MNDLKFAYRQLLQNPGFTAVAVLTLALGIGANTAMFSVINTVLLRPLPFPAPDRLVHVWQEHPKRGWPAHARFSFPNYVDLREQNRAFQDVGAMAESAHTLTGQGEPERINTLRVSASLLQTLGVRLLHGRNFTETEDRPTSERVAVLSHHLWSRSFAGDASVIGRTVRLNDEATTIVGVLPDSFRLGQENPDLLLPLRLDAGQVGRGQRGLQVIARLKAGVTARQAAVDLAPIAARLREADSWVNGDLEVSVIPLREHLVGDVRKSLLLLLGAVGLVLLIACANVMNLLLARAAGRLQEMALRAALGASRIRVIRQLFTESALLAAVGGALGLALGLAAVGTLRAVLLPEGSDWGEIALDARVLGFSCGVSLFTALVFGLAPALQSARGDLAVTLKDGGRGWSGARACSRTRGALIVSEVALALVLLIGAGLLLRSFARLQRVQAGFQTERLLALQTWLTGTRYDDNAAVRRATARELSERLGQLPGVQAVAIGTSLPFAGGMDNSGVAFEGRTFSANDYPHAFNRGVSVNYFRTLGVPLLQGRDFTEADHETAPSVVIVNLALARRYWPEESPIGKRIRPDSFPTNLWCTVIGVAADMKNDALRAPPRPEIFWPYVQLPLRGLSFLIRTTVPPETLAAAAGREIRATQPDLVIGLLKPMVAVIGDSLGVARVQLLLFGCFAGVAMALAAVGIYGVMSYSVSQRTRELGIRLALGARRGDVHRLVVGVGMKLVLAGVVVGAGGALVLTRGLSSLLYEVSATDPATFLGVSVSLVVVALAACYLPARRAGRIDPMEALRHE